MKKVFIVHGFEGSPNGGWGPWLMGELEKKDIYACALSMPSPEAPIPTEWVGEVARHVEGNKNDEIYLVGHSLGVPTILLYIQSHPEASNIKGAVLVSGPIEPNDNAKLTHFFDEEFDFEVIKTKVQKFAVIHGDDDKDVPLSNAEDLSRALGAKLIVIPNGGHLNGSSGWTVLPQCLEELLGML